MTGEGGGGAVALRDTQWRAWMLLGHWGMGWCVWVREGEQRINAHGKKPPHAPRVLDLRPAFFLSTVTCISAIASRLRLAEPPPSGGGGSAVVPAMRTSCETVIACGTVFGCHITVCLPCRPESRVGWAALAATGLLVHLARPKAHRKGK